MAIRKDFPHKEQIFPVEFGIQAQNDSQKVQGSGGLWKESGHGRVVLLYFEFCEEIGRGSPSTTTIAGG